MPWAVQEAGSDTSHLSTVLTLLLLLVASAAGPQGPSFALANNYRFAAAEFAPPKHRPRAISAVVLGGVAAAALGPEAARHLREALPVKFAGAFVLLMGLYAVHFVALLCLNYKLLKRVEQHMLHGGPKRAERHDGGEDVKRQQQQQQQRSQQQEQKPQQQQEQQQVVVMSQGEVKLRGSGCAGSNADTCIIKPSRDAPLEASGLEEHSPGAKGGGAVSLAGVGVQTQPLMSYKELLWNVDFVVAAMTAALCFAGMAALMSVTPVTMVGVGHSADVSTWVVEVHVVAMYLPGERGGGRGRGGGQRGREGSRGGWADTRKGGRGRGGRGTGVSRARGGRRRRRGQGCEV